MFCKNCGKQMKENDKFCGYCGYEIIKNADNAKDTSTDVKDIPGIMSDEGQAASVEPVAANSFEGEPAVNSSSNSSENFEKKAEIDESRIKVPERSESIAYTKSTDSVPKKIIRALLSFIICVSIAVFSFSALGIYSIREIIDSDGLDKAVKTTDISELFKKDGKKYNKVFHNSTFEEFVKEQLEDYADYILGEGRYPSGISSFDIIELLKDNERVIEKTFDIKLDDKFYNELEDEIDKKGHEMFGMFSSDSNPNDTMDLARFLISELMFVLTILVVTALLLLLIFVQKNVKGVCIWFGIPMIIISLPFIALPVVDGMIAGGLADAVGVPLVYDIASIMLGAESADVMITGLIVMGIGVLFTAAGIIWSKLKNINL